MNQFELVTLKSGVISLRSIDHAETFHPGVGPLIEANTLHVEQARLTERCSETDLFVIWDVGFGAAANAIAAIEALKAQKCHIQLHSFDQSTAPIQFALEHAVELGYILPYGDFLRRLISDRRVDLSPQLQWHLHLGDFRTQMHNSHLPSPHAILYDPYSPIGNPEMWTLEHFQALFKRLDPKVPSLLTNYTRSTSMRVALLLAGFYVGRGCSIHEKTETTVASNQFKLLQNPLTPDWLKRVRASTNAAPLRAENYSKSAISLGDLAKLEALPQFNHFPSNPLPA